VTTMTIEIHQLIIRAIVDEAPAAPSAAAAAARGSSAAAVSGPPNGPLDAAEDRQVLIAACVREVLRRLERAHER